MAETYSTEYGISYINTPITTRNYADGSSVKRKKFSYAQVLAGAASDTILLCKLPPFSELLMLLTHFTWSAFTATATIDLGWGAYTLDSDGSTVAADPDGLLDGLLLTTASTWHGGMLLTATPDDFNPIVPVKVFGNRNEVTLYATILIAAPGVAAQLNGSFYFVTP